MLDQRRVAAQPDEKREQLFTERYESLLRWAMRLTNGQQDAAEDLVQDTFVQWVLARTRLEEIENVEGYLRRMLRNMHVSRMSRSAQHLHESALSVADYDSYRMGWTAVEPARRMQAAEELHQICTYACSRKESSKAGSVLILRFFHNYFPTEIVRILNSSRNCVDQWQRVARREAKLFMSRQGRLRFMNGKPAERHSVGYLRSDCDLILGLREMIFNSCEGECLSLQELKAVYSESQADALTTTRLAHIVSCGSCLDSVNSLLSLPLLAQRYQTDPCGSKEPPDDETGGGAPGGGSKDLTKKFGRKLRETLEHKPHELRIAVNGVPVSSFKVSSESSELILNLTPDEPVEFVEVCSEQGVLLLFLSVDPTEAPDEQWALVELSEARSLEACFRNNGPSLHVIYKDPELAEARVGQAQHINNLSSPLFVVPSKNKVVDQRGGLHLRSWTKGLFWILRTIARRPIIAEETQLTKDELLSSLDETSDKIRTAPFLTVLSQPYYRDRWHSSRYLWLLTLLVSAALVGGFFFFRASLTPPLTATGLLERASVAEEITAVPDKVRHRIINLEERRSAEGAIVARRKIEIWERGTGDRAQRLYDDSNRMIAGVWQTAAGARTIYHHGSKPQPQPALATPDNLLLNLEDIWQLELLPQAFSTLIAEPSVAQVEERSTSYVLRYEKGRTIGATRLLKATLTLSKSELHPIEQTLLVQRGDELREYRFVEASFELVPVKAVAPAAFEVEPELTGGAGETGGPGANWAFRDLTSSRVPPSPSTSSPPIASAELEVDVAYLLNQAKADRNEQVALTRSAGGSLRVEGIVDTPQRKDEFLRTLAPVSNNPAVKIEIRTIAEAVQRAMPAGAVTVQEAEETSATVAADAELREYFEKKDRGGSTDEAIRSYSSRMVNGAYRALFHAIELKRLVNRFAHVDMRTVAPDARTKWLAMLHEHAAGFARENAVLCQEIEPIFFPGTSLQVTEEISLQSDADLARAIERLHKLALSNNEGIRAAFTISSQSSSAAIKSAGFWHSLQRAGNLAAKIKQYQTTSN